MMIPLINPCGTRRKKRNPIVFKSGQEGIMAGYRKYAKRMLRARPSARKLVREARSGRSPLSAMYSRYLYNPDAVPAPVTATVAVPAVKTNSGYKSPYTTVVTTVGKDSKGRYIFKETGPKILKKRPAKRRGLFHKRAQSTRSNQEGSMVYSLKRRPRRKSRRARRNPYRDAGLLSRLTGGRKYRRKARRSRRIRLGAHRPVIIRTAHAWRRPPRSKLFRRPTRINARRRTRRYGRRHYRRNPLPRLPFQLQNVVMGGLKLAGGIAIGAFGFPAIAMVMPKNAAGAPMLDRKFWGAMHVVLGAIAASVIKKEVIRTMALTVAGVGVYDLIASNIPQLGLSPISAILPFKAGDEPGIVGVDYAPALGSSYQSALGSSYGADDIAYGGDNDSLDC